MSSCNSRCPYWWHDSDCEYCSAKNDEVIDLKNYSLSTCPTYLAYLESHPEAKKEAPVGRKTGARIPFFVFAALLLAGLIAFALTRNRKTPAISPEEPLNITASAKSTEPTETAAPTTVPETVAPPTDPVFTPKDIRSEAIALCKKADIGRTWLYYTLEKDGLLDFSDSYLYEESFELPSGKGIKTEEDLRNYLSKYYTKKEVAYFFEGDHTQPHHEGGGWVKANGKIYFSYNFGMGACFYDGEDCVIKQISETAFSFKTQLSAPEGDVNVTFLLAYENGILKFDGIGS